MNRPKFPVFDLEGPSSVELSLEERYAVLMNIFKHQYFAVYRHIGQRWGWEAANDVSCAVADEAVPIIAQAYRRKFGLPGEGAALVSQVLQAEFQAEGSDVAVLNEDADSAEFTVLCTFGDALQSGKFDDVPITDGLCHRGCAGWIQDVALTVDDELKVERPEWMGDGAPRCRFTIQRAAAGQGGSS